MGPGVPYVPRCTDLTMCACCVVDAAMAVPRLWMTNLTVHSRVRVSIAVTGHTYACRFKRAIHAYIACQAREARLTFVTYRATAGICCEKTQTGIRIEQYEKFEGRLQKRILLWYFSLCTTIIF